jgi:hypothetical protein
VIYHGPKFREPQHETMGTNRFLKYGGISSTTSFLLRMLLMLIASIPLLANGIWRNFLLFS